MANQYEMSAFENCIHDPQSLLGKALAEKNISDFKKALDLEADPSRIDQKTKISIFETALQTYGCADFVEECLKRGCKCDYTNRLVNKSPINFAVTSQDPEILKKLTKFENIPINKEYANLTPLNSLAKNITSENFENVYECIKTLLDYGADVNIPDQREMTPILYILNNKKIENEKKKEVLEYFLKVTDVDLDTYRDGEARKKISSLFSDLELPNRNDSAVTYDVLLANLRNENEDKFLQGFNQYNLNSSGIKENQQNVVQENNVIFLIQAIKKGLNRAVDAIIKSGVNINLTDNQNSPIEVACIYGNWEALKYLIEHEDLKLRKFENLLITVIKKLDEPTYNDFCDYNKCFSLLLNSNIIDINETDQSGSSALHYAVKYKNENVIMELLKHGAYVGTKSKFGDLPISEIDPQTLEDYFDSCITTNVHKPGDDEFEIIFNYRNLIPNQTHYKKRNIYNVQEEMLPIEHIAETKDLRHLLKHPLIMSFLFLKWHRLSIVFYLNFILYALFCGSLVTYIILDFNNTQNEVALHTFKIFSFVGLLYMIIREAIQFLISPYIFIKSVVNYLEVTLIILTIVMLCNPNYEKETQRVLAVFTILLASVELCLLVGSLPVLSISTHMLMLRAVLSTFLKSFTLYSIFVITFSLCFYILFGRTEPKPEDDKKDDNDEGEFNKFANPFTAIIKTIVMLTGEFDAGDIDFQSFTSYLVFLLFVFFMSIVLFNLLNGLAVSDTQAIKSQAELNGCICRTNLLASYERVLTGKNNVTGFFVNLQPFRIICNKLINLYPNYIPCKCIIVMPNNGNKIYVPVSHSKENISSLLKKNGEIVSGLPAEDLEKSLLRGVVSSFTCGFPCLEGECSRMDVRTVKTALIILDRKRKSEEKREKLKMAENRLQGIEAKVNKIFELLKEISNKRN